MITSNLADLGNKKKNHDPMYNKHVVEEEAEAEDVGSKNHSV